MAHLVARQEHPECTAIAPLAGALYKGASLTAGLQPLFWLALAFAGLGCGLYNAACVLAPKYITGAEVALILLLETVGGPIWVFIIFGDVPDNWTLLSGALLIASLVAHEVAGMRAAAQEDDSMQLWPEATLRQPLNPDGVEASFKGFCGGSPDPPTSYPPAAARA